VIVAVIPALDEEETIAEVVKEIRQHVDVAVVVDNGSRDATAEAARAAGAELVREPMRGYGAACLSGVARARELGADVVLFLDADGSDDPSDAPRLLGPVVSGACDLALGIRTRASTEPGAMMPVQRFGNWLAPRLMRIAVGARYGDMPPFKAIRMAALERLALRDAGMGYIVEMLLKAHARRLRVLEIEVKCRARRAGTSKISGTIRGTLRASLKITTSIARHALFER
jgi:glycosyltransferase involved in cell wall biosynthesis